LYYLEIAISLISGVSISVGAVDVNPEKSLQKNLSIFCLENQSCACGGCLQDRAKVLPRMFRNGPAMCAQPAAAAFLLALNNPALQAFHQHLQSLFSRAVPCVPPAAST